MSLRKCGGVTGVQGGKVMMCVGACTKLYVNSFFVQFCVKACSRKFADVT